MTLCCLLHNSLLKESEQNNSFLMRVAWLCRLYLCYLHSSLLESVFVKRRSKSLNSPGKEHADILISIITSADKFSRLPFCLPANIPFMASIYFVYFNLS